jgi:hypothetical protein
MFKTFNRGEIYIEFTAIFIWNYNRLFKVFTFISPINWNTETDWCKTKIVRIGCGLKWSSSILRIVKKTMENVVAQILRERKTRKLKATSGGNQL